MVVVTVDTTQLHILAVDLKHLAHNLDLLHTEVVVKCFVVLAILDLRSSLLTLGRADASIALLLLNRSLAKQL